MMGVAVTDLKLFGMGGKLLRKKGPNRKGAPKSSTPKMIIPSYTKKLFAGS